MILNYLRVRRSPAWTPESAQRRALAYLSKYGTKKPKENEPTTFRVVRQDMLDAWEQHLVPQSQIFYGIIVKYLAAANAWANSVDRVRDDFGIDLSLDDPGLIARMAATLRQAFFYEAASAVLEASNISPEYKTKLLEEDGRRQGHPQQPNVISKEFIDLMRDAMKVHPKPKGM